MLRSDIKKLLPYAVAGLLLTSLAVLLAVDFFSYGHTAKEDSEGYKLKVAGSEVTLELACTPWERQRGLKHRNWLPEDHGMLFIFPEDNYLSFWMKDTYIPISIAFVSEGGTITQIESMEPLTLSSHVSKERVRYALEMSAGWFERHDVKVGDRIELPHVVASN